MKDLFEWMVHASLALAVLIPLAWLLSGVLRRYGSARIGYAAWLIPLPGLLPPGIWSTPPTALPSMAVRLGDASLAESVVSAAANAGSTSMLLVAGWATGAVIVGLAFGWRQHRFERSLRAGATEGNDGLWQPLFPAAGVPAWLTVIETRACQAPLLAGVLRPRLYLPSNFPDSDAEDRRLVLMHEMAHLRHGDPLWNGLLVVMRALFWFHPLVHLAWARVRGDQELAADETVVASIALRHRLGYARLLCLSGGIESHHLGSAWTASSSLRERMKMIANHEYRKLPRTLGISLILAGLLLAGSIGATGPDTGEAANDMASGKMEKLGGFDPEQDDPASLSPIVRVKPQWPRDALIEGTEGHVTMEATVTTEGKITDIEVVEAEPEGVFEEVAIAAFERWRVSPLRTRSGDQRREGRVRQTIHFRLDD